MNAVKRVIGDRIDMIIGVKRIIGDINCMIIGVKRVIDDRIDMIVGVKRVMREVKSINAGAFCFDDDTQSSDHGSF
ncbi:MAG: hypothetical protein ACM3SY_19960 [Candidatus Omnitrophota bacterium]